MSKILNLNKASKICKELHEKHETIVLVGGVFDILHYGHVRFLEAAKKQGDTLMVALEPDRKVKKIKGDGRPVNNEKIRAQVVAALSCVDYVVILPELKSDKDYLKMTKKISPDVIAVTEGDSKIEEKRKQAKSIGAKLKIVTPKIPTPSTSKLLRLLALE